MVCRHSFPPQAGLSLLWDDTALFKLSAAKAIDTPEGLPIVLTSEVQVKSRTTTYELEWLRERVVLFLGNDTNISHAGLRKKGDERQRFNTSSIAALNMAAHFR